MLKRDPAVGMGTLSSPCRSQDPAMFDVVLLQKLTGDIFDEVMGSWGSGGFQTASNEVWCVVNGRSHSIAKGAHLSCS